MAQTIYLIVLVIMSVIDYTLMGIDKKRAQRGDTKHRIPEKTLFLFAILLGATGGTLAMYGFRHKTKHWYFKYGFPILGLLQAFLPAILKF